MKKNKLIRYSDATEVHYPNKRIIVAQKDNRCYIRFKRMATPDEVKEKSITADTFYKRNIVVTTIAVSEDALEGLFFAVKEELIKLKERKLKQ